MECNEITQYIGKIVHIVVDRPIGYRRGDILYPINYGYVPGLLVGDGEEQDAYILGVNELIAEFDSQVVAVIHRKNDCEDKLVVAPVGNTYHQGQIATAVHFQEQYFDTRIISAFEKSCGVLPPPVAAMLERKHGCFDSLVHDVHIVSGETDLDAVISQILSK